MFDSVCIRDVYRIRDHGHNAGRRPHRRGLGVRRGARLGGSVCGGPGRVGCRSRPRDAMVRRHAGDSLGGHRPPLLQPCDRPGRDGAGHRGGRSTTSSPCGSGSGSACACCSRCRTARRRPTRTGCGTRGLEPFDQQDRIVRVEGAATTDPVRSEREFTVERVRPGDRGRVVASSCSASTGWTPAPGCRSWSTVPAGTSTWPASAARSWPPVACTWAATASPGSAWTARCRGS